MDQVKKGRLTRPSHLNSDGKPDGWRSAGYNIAFRFGAQQDSKLRACDGLMRRLTNRCCRDTTPIQLATWDHLARLAHIMAKNGGE